MKPPGGQIMNYNKPTEALLAMICLYVIYGTKFRRISLKSFNLQIHMICSFWSNEVVHHVRTHMQYL